EVGERRNTYPRHIEVEKGVTRLCSRVPGTFLMVENTVVVAVVIDARLGAHKHIHVAIAVEIHEHRSPVYRVNLQLEKGVCGVFGFRIPRIFPRARIYKIFEGVLSKAVLVLEPSRVPHYQVVVTIAIEVDGSRVGITLKKERRW